MSDHNADSNTESNTEDNTEINTEINADRIEPDWLALREPADAAARDRSWPALRPAIAAWLTPRLAGGDGPLHVVDAGAGTGANARWLAPRLTALASGHPVRWTLLDHDDRLLAHVPPGLTARRVCGDLADLPGLLRRSESPEPESVSGPGTRATLVTASALLDLLTADQLDRFVDDALAADAALLVALTIGPTWRLEPLDGPDARLSDRLDAAFHEHQGRGRALGHRAIDRLVDRHPRALRADSPWQLNAADPADAALIDRFLTERAAAAVAARPELRDPARSWLERRRADLRRGRLTVRLEHTDVWLSPQ